jgi:hypothetical protein
LFTAVQDLHGGPLVFLFRLWYTIHKTSGREMWHGVQTFVILTTTGEEVPVQIVPAKEADLQITRGIPAWQTDWTSEFLTAPMVDKYAVKAAGGELIALGAYQIRGRSAYVYIIYAESAPPSNPTIKAKERRKYYGIGELLIAYGIKYSIDNGCRGDVVFDAKTDELAHHYETDFHARRVANLASGGPKRYMLADEGAWALFSKFLKEVEA